MDIVTDAFWQSVDDVLRNQQVGEQRQVAQLLWKPLQFVFGHVQTQQALHVANFLKLQFDTRGKQVNYNT